MRVLVLGAGALGGLYGSRLMRGGADVTFLVRENRARQLARTGLIVTSPFGDYRSPVRTVLASQLDAGYDLVLVSCKSYDLENAIGDFAPAVSDGTAVMSVLNGVRHIDILSDRFGPENIIGATSYASTTLGPDGEVRHLEPRDWLMVGNIKTSAASPVGRIKDVLDRTKGDTEISDDIYQELWEKFCNKCAGVAVACTMRACVANIHEAQDGLWFIKRVLEEVHAIAAAVGRPFRKETVEKGAGMLMSPTSRLTGSMLRDIDRGTPRLEWDILADLIRRGSDAGLDAPTLRIALANLQAYEARQRDPNARDLLQPYADSHTIGVNIPT